MSDNQSGPLGIDEAASAIGALLSPETPADDKQEPKKRNAAQADLEGEDHAEDDEDSEEPEEGDEESDDDEGEPDPDEDDEEESLAAARPGKLHTVKVDGKDTQVSEAELISSYQRQADYTRKSMALAESRKANDTELQALKQERQQYAHWAQQMVQQLQRQAPQEPDWNQLRQSDPVAFAAAWADHQRYREYTAGVTAQYEQAMQANRDAEARQMEQVLAAEAERLNAALPEWTDKTRASKEKAALLDYGRQSGFSDDELNSVYDHRTVIVLRKAMLFDRIQSRRPEVAAAKVQPNIAAPSQSVSSAVRRAPKAMQRLAKTGSLRDAAAALDRFL